MARLEKMNRTRSENKYRFYCTSDPATWETNNSTNQVMPESEIDKTRREYHEKEREGEVGWEEGLLELSQLEQM